MERGCGCDGPWLGGGGELAPLPPDLALTHPTGQAWSTTCPVYRRKGTPSLANMPGLGLAKLDFVLLFFFSPPSLIPGAKERAYQKKHSSSEDGLAEAPDKQNDQAEQKGQCCQSSQKWGREDVGAVLIRIGRG